MQKNDIENIEPVFDILLKNTEIDYGMEGETSFYVNITKDVMVSDFSSSSQEIFHRLGFNDNTNLSRLLENACRENDIVYKTREKVLTKEKH